MQGKDLQNLAGKEEWYPEIRNLIGIFYKYFAPEMSLADTLRIIRDVFLGLTEADIKGYISVGDEHEWAAVAVLANKLATIEANRILMKNKYGESR